MNVLKPTACSVHVVSHCAVASIFLLFQSKKGRKDIFILHSCTLGSFFCVQMCNNNLKATLIDVEKLTSSVSVHVHYVNTTPRKDEFVGPKCKEVFSFFV